MTTEEYYEEFLTQTKADYCNGNWEKVVEYFGEETASSFDFFDNFDYQDAYDNGDEKELLAYYNIAVIQFFLVANLFDHSNVEVATTVSSFEYWCNKLYEKVRGEEHLWIH